VLGNHDQHRVATRLGVERTDLINIMLQTLPGIAVTYQGEELGLKNTHLSWEDTVDPAACNTNEQVYEQYSRDGCRTPFPWDATANGGFSNTTGATWLPLNPDYLDGMNLAAQENAANSHLKIFKRLTKLRTHNVLRQGEYKSKLVNNENVILYLRKFGTDWAVVILNFGSTQQTVNVKNEFSEETTLPSTMNVYAASLDTLANESTQDLTQVTVQKDKAVVLSTVTYASLLN
jgi:alpha-glucosidase